MAQAIRAEEQEHQIRARTFEQRVLIDLAAPLLPCFKLIESSGSTPQNGTNYGNGNAESFVSAIINGSFLRTFLFWCILLYPVSDYGERHAAASYNNWT